MKHLFSESWINLVFHAKNQEYGAYQLRKSASDYQFYGLMIANLVFITLIIIYKISIPAESKTGIEQRPEAVFKNNKDKELEMQNTKTSLPEVELKITEVNAMDLNMQWPNFKIVKDPVIEPVVADISDGVMKYAIDPKTGKHFIPEKIATYQGGMDSFYVSVGKQIKFKSDLGLDDYQYVNGDDEIDGEITTVVFIECVVTVSGKLDSVKLFKGASDPKFNDRILEAFKNSKAWKPAMQNGVAVNQKMIIPYHFAYKQPLIKYYRF